MHVLHGNTATPTKGPTGNVEAWRFLLNEPASTQTRLEFALVWPWKAPRRYIRSKEAMELLTGLRCMTQTGVRSDVVARLMFSQESPASIWLR